MDKLIIDLRKYSKSLAGVLGLLLVIGLLLGLTFPYPALAFPPVPDQFFGSISVNGAQAAVGTLVEVKYGTNPTTHAGGTVVASQTLTTAGQYGYGATPLLASWEGAASGTLIDFFVTPPDGCPQTYAATAAFQSGRVPPLLLNLTVTGVVCPDIVTMNLEAGWNMVSVPWYVIGTGTSPNVFFAALGANLNTVYAFNDCTSTWSSWNKVTGGSLTIDDGKGYWVNISSPVDFKFIGYLNSLNPLDGMPSYNVCTGWNLIGFKNGDMTTSVANYLAGTNFVSIYTFDNGSWQIPITLEPGLAYWVAFTTPGVIYP